MTELAITRVEIREDGRLCVTPSGGDFAHIHRAAMGVQWDPDRCCLFAPKPEQTTYPDVFRRILVAAADEYGTRLMLTPATTWVNVPDSQRADMVSSKD